MIALIKKLKLLILTSQGARKNALSALFLVFWFLTQALVAQQRFPATVSVNIVPPYTTYLTDYISLGSNKLTATVIFNDLSEPSWDVYLKVKIESNNLRIKTRDDYVPSSPLTLTPGVPVQISGDQLYQYFDFNNIDVTGMSKTELRTTGRLIEGNYSFCFEVYDYKNHKLISQEGCAFANVRLNDAPKLVLPEDKYVISLGGQNINFQWQLPSGDPNTTKYKLSVYELPDYKSDPAVAVQTNKALKIFESAELDNPLFLYDINAPLLKQGKRYAWRVQALNINGRDEFKNNGFSIIRTFYYGYPENGAIIINAPEDGHAFTLRQSYTFRWNAPDNLTNSQSYFYRIKVVRVEPDQTDSAALANNIPVYTNQTGTLSPSDPDFEITAPSNLFVAQQRYAWCVTAHTNNQTIASSTIYHYFGPPLLEAFYAGNHTVFVTHTTSTNVNDLTGEGEVEISYAGKMQKVSFKHIKIETIGALLIMTRGCVKGKYEGDKITIRPEYAGNGNATFIADSVKIDTEYMRLKGVVKWPFPHPTVNPSIPFIVSKPDWVLFEDYLLLGQVYLKDSLAYELADPYGFSVNLDTSSYLLLRNNNKYCPKLNGKVTLPNKVRNTAGSKTQLPFTGSDRLDFIDQKSNSDGASLDLIEGSNIGLYPSSYVIDFSDSQSPNKLSGQPDWKGICITNSFVEFPLSPDKSNQLFFKNPLRYSVKDSIATNDSCWVTSEGLQMKLNKAAENADTLWFNTFPGVFNGYSLTIQNSDLISGYFKGQIAIPILSETKRFSFTVPLTTRGFATGYLDESLEGFAAVFNPDGGEQVINLKVNRAVFADNMRLDMNIDLLWPLMDLNMKSLEGFEAWGNGNIGFMVANGTTPLTTQLQSRVNGFEVNIDYIGCGRQENYYSFGTSAKIVMAEDVAGPDGAPVVNIFSIAKNSLLTGNGLPMGLPDRFQNILGQSGGKSQFGTNTTVGVKQQVDSTQAGNANDIIDGNEVNNEFASILGEIKPTTTPDIDTIQLFRNPLFDDLSELADEDISLETITKLIDKIEPFLKEEQKVKALAFKQKLTELDQSELIAIYHELKDFDKFIKEMAKQLVQVLVAKINQPILNQSNKIKGKITGFINSKRDSLLDFVDDKIYMLVDSLANKVINAVASDAKQGKESLIADIISTTADAVKEGLTRQINSSVKISIQRNITDKVIGLIDTAIVFKITTFVDSSITTIGYAIIEKGINADLKLDNIGRNAENLLPSIGEDVWHRIISFDLLETVKSTIVDAYKGIRWDSVGTYVAEQVMVGLIEKKVKEKLTKAVTNLATNAFGETGGAIAGAVMNNVKLDFSNLGEKLKNGEIDKIIKFDPSYIKVKTKVAIFEGWVKFTNDDPVWGDSWQADIKAQILVGLTFTATAKYINGSVASKNPEKNGATFKYWFLELGIFGLNVPLTPMPITFDGAKGKVFHHMVRVSPGVYLPADSVKFGAGLQIFMFDTPSQGSIIAFDVGAEITILEGGFIFEMFGNAAIGNGNVVVAGIDFGKKSVIFAHGYLMYNSIEKHFLATFSITFNTAPILCAGGEMGVDIKPGSWYIYAGKKEQPIYINMFCLKNPMFKGWFEANNDGIDMGLLIYIHIIAESPWLGFPGFRVKPWGELLIDFGAIAIIDFKPKFEIEEARVWLDFYVAIGAEYDLPWPLGDGNMTFVSINLGGEVLFTTVPKAYISGDLYGKIVVFNVGVGFKLHADHTFG